MSFFCFPVLHIVDPSSHSSLVDVSSVSSAQHTLSDAPSPPSNLSVSPTPQPLHTPKLQHSTDLPDEQSHESIDCSHATVHTHPVPDRDSSSNNSQSEQTQGQISSNDDGSHEHNATDENNSQNPDSLMTDTVDGQPEHGSHPTDESDQTKMLEKPLLDPLALLAQVEEEAQRFEFDLTPDLEGDQNIDPESLLAEIKAETENYNSNGSEIIPSGIPPSKTEDDGDYVDITGTADNPSTDVASAEENLCPSIPSGSCESSGDKSPVEIQEHSYDEPDKVPSKMLGLKIGTENGSPVSHLTEMAESPSEQNTPDTTPTCDTDVSKSSIDHQSQPYDEPDAAPSRKKALKEEIVTKNADSTSEPHTPGTRVVEHDSETVKQDNAESRYVLSESNDSEIPVHDVASVKGGTVESSVENLDCQESSPEASVSLGKESIEHAIHPQIDVQDGYSPIFQGEENSVISPPECTSNNIDEDIAGKYVETFPAEDQTFTSDEASSGNVPEELLAEIQEGTSAEACEVHETEPKDVSVQDPCLSQTQTNVVEEKTAIVIEDCKDTVTPMNLDSQGQPLEGLETSTELSSPPATEASPDGHPDLPVETLTYLSDMENLESQIDEEPAPNIEEESVVPVTEVVHSSPSNEESSLRKGTQESTVPNAQVASANLQAEAVESSDVTQVPADTITQTTDSVTHGASQELAEIQNTSQTPHRVIDTPSAITSPSTDHDIADFVIVKHEDVYNQIQNEDLRLIANGQSEPKEEVCEQREEVEEEQAKEPESTNLPGGGHGKHPALLCTF